MSSLVQVFENIKANYNLAEGQNRGLWLDYHIFNGAVDTLIYELEITNLLTQEKVSLPCFIFLQDDPQTLILKTLELLDQFVKTTTDF